MLNLVDLISMIRRRLPVILLLTALGGLISYLVAVRQPHLYEAAAVLQVDLPRISAEVGQSTLVSRSAQRLQLLEQELLSREGMLALAAKHRLFDDEPDLSETQKVVALRSAIRIETVRAGRDPFGGEQPVSAMLIVVRIGDGVVAAAIANELADKVLELTVERQSAQVRETLGFYENEDKRLGMAIAALESEIASYKNANIDALPEGTQSRRDEVSRVEDILQQLDSQLSILRQDLSMLTARGSPRVIEQRQIAALETQIATLMQQRDEASARRALVEEAVRRAPTVEIQLGTFARRLTQLQDQYSVITRRRAEAETSERLDSERQTERFALLEAALPPDYPLGSGRRKTLILGLGMSVVLSMVLAFLLELRNPVLRSARSLERQLDLKPVIALPVLRPVTGRGIGWGRSRRGMMALGAGIITLLLGLAAQGGKLFSGWGGG